MRICLIIVLFTFSLFAGCVKRTISISSNPSGALVWVNDREVGRTPVEFEFLYYGEYDLRLERDDYEPIMTTQWAKSPVWDLPIVDLFAEVVAPGREAKVFWNFELEPRDDNSALLLYRANRFRRQAQESDNE
ncbi:MAG: PEGA domain-containing protein [Planctomycetota bacterium]|nr:PEGA domain-containing protein [Planctomycetota bacterium]